MKINLKKFRIYLLFAVLTLTLSLTSISTLGATEYSGTEYKNAGGYQSSLEYPEDVVFVDTGGNGGATNYGVWLKGAMDNWWQTSIRVYMYVRVYCVHIDLWKLTRTYKWEEAPSGLMYLNGNFDYQSSSISSWEWQVGASYKSFSFSMSGGTSGAQSWWANGNSVSGGWRYIGLVGSYKLGHPGTHTFTMFLRIKVDNDIARDWYNGIEYELNGRPYVKEIQKVQIKFAFKYYWSGYFGPWLHCKTHEHIAGDGIEISGGGGSDLSNIYFVKGSAS